MSKTITVRLSASGIDKAVHELREYKLNVERKAKELVQMLCDDGQQIAVIQAENIRMTGNLLSSIKSHANGNAGIVACECGYAVFVEFGTGIVGNNNPHPDLAILGWEYDVNGHGDLGWWYPTTAADKNKYKYRKKNGDYLAWTKGMPSRPFMFNTAQELKNLVIPYARSLF